MGLNTKLTLSNDKFNQESGNTFNFSGETEIYGLLTINSGATLSILPNHGLGKVLTSDENGQVSWQNPVTGGTSGGGITGATNGLTVNGSNQVGLGGVLTGDTCINYDSGCLCLTDTDGNNIVEFANTYSYFSNYDGSQCGSSITVNCNYSNMYSYDIRYASEIFACPLCALLTSYDNDTSVSTNLIMTWGGMVIGAYDGSVSNPYSGFSGITYEHDYSANFVDRSLVDKGWVMSQISTGGTSYTFSNGLVESGGVVVLGGVLTGDTCINVDNGIFRISGGTGFGFDATTSRILLGDVLNEMEVVTVCQGSVDLFQDDGSQYSDIFLNPEYIQITTDNCIGDQTVIEICTRAVKVFNSGSDFSGVTYGGDYSANFLDRSLVDKGWVMSQISGGTSGGTSYTFSNGLVESGGVVVLGGMLTGDTIICGIDHKLNLGDDTSATSALCEINIITPYFNWADSCDYNSYFNIYQADTNSGLDMYLGGTVCGGAGMSLASGYLNIYGNGDIGNACCMYFFVNSNYVSSAQPNYDFKIQNGLHCYQQRSILTSPNVHFVECIQDYNNSGLNLKFIGCYSNRCFDFISDSSSLMVIGSGGTKICNLQAKTVETCAVYINATGDLSYGVAGVITDGGTSYLYFGSSGQTDSWRIGVSGTTFIHQCWNGSLYVTKHSI